MPKVKIGKIEPNENELKTEKILVKDISKIKTIEKTPKVKTTRRKTKTNEEIDK